MSDNSTVKVVVKKDKSKSKDVWFGIPSYIKKVKKYYKKASNINK
jgi:hypothetical protein